MSYWGDYKPYVSVGDRKAKAERKLAQLRKKNPNIQPITIKGRSLATTWWGKAWNKNLEDYADYSNRIGRGRSYVRNSAVLDLQIKSGVIISLVLGSSSSPYNVKISIDPLSQSLWTNIKKACQGKLDSLQELLDGKFPKTLEEVFTQKKTGLFPSTSEISFNCSCPDGASMCKHVAATLYGIGARLDHEPSLFFTLRKLKIEDLITQAIKEKKTSLLEKAQQKSDRVLKNDNLSSLFGIDMEFPSSFKKIEKRKTTRKKKETKATKKPEPKTTQIKKTKKTRVTKKKVEPKVVEKAVKKIPQKKVTPLRKRKISKLSLREKIILGVGWFEEWDLAKRHKLTITKSTYEFSFSEWVRKRGTRKRKIPLIVKERQNKVSMVEAEKFIKAVWSIKRKNKVKEAMVVYIAANGFSDNASTYLKKYGVEVGTPDFFGV